MRFTAPLESFKNDMMKACRNNFFINVFSKYCVSLCFMLYATYVLFQIWLGSFKIHVCRLCFYYAFWWFVLHKLAFNNQYWCFPILLYNKIQISYCDRPSAMCVRMFRESLEKITVRLFAHLLGVNPRM